MKMIILYSTAGMGHKKAAFALLEAFREKKIEAEAIDSLEYSTAFYKFLYTDFYVFLSNSMKWLWAFIYYFSGIGIVDILTRKLRALSDYSAMPELGELLIKKQPDAVIATHFMLPSISGILRKKGLKAKMYTLVTDYGPHYCWFSESMDGFFAGCDVVRSGLVKRGAEPGKIFVTGIPTEAKFNISSAPEKTRKEFGLEDGRKTVFIMGGGFGVGPITGILSALDSCKAEMQVLAVCGKNKELYDRLSGTKYNFKLIPVGFTDKVAEIMSVSDIMITKAGGMSVTEAMNARLPMILYASIPGQESWNVDFLVKSGAAKLARELPDITRLADTLLSNEEEYAEMKRGIGLIRKPDAARDIVDIVMAGVEKGNI